uniref:Uncharacterized protein n=1 Tax=Tetranychus urticae TaxID=32264 RepID=T1KQ40_TETUR
MSDETKSEIQHISPSLYPFILS